MEGCGAYCTESTPTYNFDVRNGRVLVKAEIITPQGRLALAALAIKLHGARLRAEIARLRKPGYRHEFLSEEEFAEQRDTYERCLSERYVKGGDSYQYSLQDPGEMSIDDGGLTFVQGECAIHALRALDDLGAYSLVLQGEQMRPYLSAYGRYLLLGEGDGAMPAINPYAQIYKGLVNHTIAITLYIGNDEPGGVFNSPYSGARYLYDKYRLPIELTETRNGDQIVLTESASTDTPKPTLSFRVQGGKLVGQWSGGGKAYPFEAEPY